ncbi:MAG: acyl-CoA dehydrogenase family protein [Alphaproteobacteria bacterium]
MFGTALEKSLRQHLLILEPQRPNRNISAIETWEHAHAFSQKIIRPLDDTAYQKDAFPHELWAEAGAAGIKGVIIPEEYGGSGLGNLELCLTVMETARASGALTVSLVCDQALASRQIATFGNQEQKQKYLPGLASGHDVGALAMSEPNAGSDVMSMTTRARKIDGGFVVNGSKYWITNGARFDPVAGKNTTADTLVLYAKTDDSEKLTAFIIDGVTEGFEAGGIIKKATTKGSDTAELVFNDCFVPDENVLGEVGKGATVLMPGLNVERLVFAANTIGVAQAAYEEVQEYLVQREQFGRSIAFNQSVALGLGNMFSKIDMAQKYITSTALQSDLDPNAFARNNDVAASVFLQAGVIAQEVTDTCQQLYGGVGHTVDFRIDRQRGIAALLLVGAGSKQMRETIIARAVVPGYAHHVEQVSGLMAQHRAAAEERANLPTTPQHSFELPATPK